MKKTIAALLSTAVLLSAANLSAVAAVTPTPTESTGIAGINFTDGEGPGIVTPPDESGIKSSDLYFGDRELNTTRATYLSTDRNVGIDEDQSHAGLMVVNPRKNLGWTVTAEITKFEKKSGGDTLDGFELYLMGELSQEDSDFLAAPSIPAVTDKMEGGSGDTVLVLSPDGRDGMDIGTFGVNYAGKLVVPLGAAEKGEAQATMTWHFVIA